MNDPKIPMEPNEIPDYQPTKSGVFISRPYIIDITKLATKKQYKTIGDFAKTIIKFFKRSDNRVLGQRRFRLVRFDRDTSTEDMIEQGRQNNLISPPMLYLNDFVKANPGVVKRLNVVILGEPNKPCVVHDKRKVLMVFKDCGGLKLISCDWNQCWREYYWFLFCEA